MKLIFRNWRRNYVSSTISILSLVIGLTCTNLLVAFVVNEWKISKCSKDNDSIYLIKSDIPMDLGSNEKTSFTMSKLPALLKERYPEVEAYCRFQSINNNPVFETNNYSSDQIHFVGCDDNLGDYFNLPVIVGNIQKSLSSINGAVITKRIALKVFGNVDVLGKAFYLKSNNGKDLYKISSVIDDTEISSFLKFDILLPINDKSYFGGVTLVKLDQKASSSALLEKINEDKDILPKLNSECKYYLQQLDEFYFDSSETQTNWNFIIHRNKSFLIIGIIASIAILLISCFNYINMYLVRIIKTEKSISIQSLFGASKNQLRFQLINEAFCAVFIAFIWSIILVMLFIPTFNNIFEAHLSASFLTNHFVLLSFITLIVLLTFSPSLYILSSHKSSPIEQLRKSATPHFKANTLNVMVVVQFTISIILIIAAISYSRQLNFISKTADIDKNIIEVNANNISTNKLITFKNEVVEMSGVQSGTISNANFLNAWITTDEKGNSFYNYTVDCDFIKTHNLRLIEGENFSSNLTADKKKVIVNETFIKNFGIDAPVGKSLPVISEDFIIKGVIADFYTESFTNEIKPSIIYSFGLNTINFAQTLQLQLSDNDVTQTLSSLENKWNTFYPDKSFNYTFLQDQFELLHSNNFKTIKIIQFFTWVSLLLTAAGLLGISWYSVDRRIKEIGIRKVNGANISEVLTMLNKDFFKWVVIAFIIAAPLSYYTMQKWLENFAYKAEMSWWIFALAGILVLGIALLTVSWQSWKAATRKPVEALRYE